jgi:hypothetical protein
MPLLELGVNSFARHFFFVSSSLDGKPTQLLDTVPHANWIDQKEEKEEYEWAFEARP